MRREVLAALVLAWGHGLVCATGTPAVPDAAASPAFSVDEPPDAQAVAAYLADVLMPAQGARRTPSGYALVDQEGRVSRSIDVAVARHQCWKIKDGYQCQSTVRNTTTPTGGRPRTAMLEITNDYQWRDGRLFSVRLEAARPQAVARTSGTSTRP